MNNLRISIILLLYLLNTAPIHCQNFTPEYIREFKGKWSLEVPEVQELAHIIIALTSTGISDSNMVEHRGEYYQDVINHFGKYRNSKIVTEIDNQLKSNQSFYARFKMDACGYEFDNKNQLIKVTTYNQLNWSNKNYVKPYVKELQKFASETDFRKFYAEHTSYYENLKSLLQNQIPIDKQWKWLEAHFPLRYDNYRITFSPLVNGSHSTNNFTTTTFKQTVMFICGPIQKSKYNEKIVEGLMTRVVFTEIDHNYVNPISDTFRDEITTIFSNRNKWTEGKYANYYQSPMAVFNEYMTWSVFTLYALDNFIESDFTIINERTELQMVNSRGFPEYKAFNQKMIELYKQSTTKNIVELYPVILAWCKSR